MKLPIYCGALFLSLVTAFQSSNSALRSFKCSRICSHLTGTASSSDEGKDELRVLALSEYLIKAHEDKLRAIHDVEKKKSAEIQALKDEIAFLQGKRASASAISLSSFVHSDATNLMNLPKEALVNKIGQYQKFMKSYIVKAHEQKVLAVRAAEESLRNKFSMFALPSSSVSARVTENTATTATAVAAAPAGESALYKARNEALKAAARVGKSRWGDAEVNRSGSLGIGAVESSVSAALASQIEASATQSESIIPESAIVPQRASSSMTFNVGALAVAEASESSSRESMLQATHGVSKSINIGANALSKASENVRIPVARGIASNRVNIGEMAVVQASSSSSSSSSDGSPTAVHEASSKLYKLRNHQVLAAAAVGKSRWGNEEVAQIQKMLSLSGA